MKLVFLYTKYLIKSEFSTTCILIQLKMVAAKGICKRRPFACGHKCIDLNPKTDIVSHRENAVLIYETLLISVLNTLNTVVPLPENF